MRSTYKATVRGDRIEWDDDVPDEIRSRPTLTVLVTIPDSPGEPAADGHRQAEALGRLAARGGPSSIEDAVQWQREQRRDRDLPGRP
jgi:hypothetical protein